MLNNHKIILPENFYSASPFQMLSAMQARLDSIGKDNFVFCKFKIDNLDFISAFERARDNIWKCFILGEAFLFCPKIPNTGQLLQYLHEVTNQLNASGLYFPHVNINSPHYQLLRSVSNILQQERLPSPIIDWYTDGVDFISVLRQRSKQRAVRSWNKFERSLEVGVLTGTDAVDALANIERRTWKFSSKQSMHHRDHQLDFYSNWLLSGNLTMQVALDASYPIAYRLDCRVGDVVYALKYSYDDNYKKFSPGYYLLTKGIYGLWQSRGVKTIDLWGSPDLLKNHISTHQYGRTDFFWPPCSLGRQFLLERAQHDHKLSDAVQSDNGLKSVFNQATGTDNG